LRVVELLAQVVDLGLGLVRALDRIAAARRIGLELALLGTELGDGRLELREAIARLAGPGRSLAPKAGATMIAVTQNVAVIIPVIARPMARLANTSSPLDSRCNAPNTIPPHTNMEPASTDASFRPTVAFTTHIAGPRRHDASLAAPPLHL